MSVFNSSLKLNLWRQILKWICTWLHLSNCLNWQPSQKPLNYKQRNYLLRQFCEICSHWHTTKSIVTIVKVSLTCKMGLIVNCVPRSRYFLVWPHSRVTSSFTLVTTNKELAGIAFFFSPVKDLSFIVISWLCPKTVAWSLCSFLDFMRLNLNIEFLGIEFSNFQDLYVFIAHVCVLFTSCLFIFLQCWKLSKH